MLRDIKASSSASTSHNKCSDQSFKVLPDVDLTSLYFLEKLATNAANAAFPALPARGSLNGASFAATALVVTRRNQAMLPCLSHSNDFSQMELCFREATRSVISFKFHFESRSVVFT